MRSHTSGPLSALFVLAPLAAVPILAIVGVPQFAPVVASSPADEEPTLGLSDAPPAPAATSKNGTRSAQDLFAPVGGEENPRGGGLLDTLGQGSGNQSSANPDAGDQGQVARQRTPRDWTGDAVPLRPQVSRPGRVTPPPEALDGWEVVDQDSPRVDEGAAAKDSDEFAAVTEQPPVSERFSDTPANAEMPSNRRRRPYAPPGTAVLDIFAPPEKSSPEKALPDASMPEETSDAGGNTAEEPFAADEPPVAKAATAAPAVEMLEEPFTWHMAAKRLKQLGVKRYRLQSLPDEEGFVFSCSVVQPDNPRVAHRFEADADEPLLAVQRVLEQIQDWQEQH